VVHVRRDDTDDALCRSHGGEGARQHHGGRHTEDPDPDSIPQAQAPILAEPSGGCQPTMD
jgi:hypothetical protein